MSARDVGGPSVRGANVRGPEGPVRELDSEQLSPLFLAAIEATEEAIYDSLCLATTVAGQLGRVVEALPYRLLAP